MKKLILIVSLVVVFGCSDDASDPTTSFLKIYDDSDADVKYKPIDVVQTTGGYMILTGAELDKTDFMGVQLINTDEKGEFRLIRQLTNYVVPIGDMYLIDSLCYFFAMNPTSLNAILLGVNTQLVIESEVSVAVNYPLASAMTSSGEFLLLSYDNVNLTTEISTVALDGSVTGGTSYSIGPGDDVAEEIINHYLNASERPLPFFCGETTAGNYFFNGFYNYSFSLVFTDLGAAPVGVVQGQGSSAGIRSAMYLSGSDFAISGFQFDNNFQLSSVAVSTSGTTSSADLYTGNMAELKAYTPSRILSYELGATSYTVFAAETESRQIVLYFYDATSGEVKGIYHLGYQNPYSLASLKIAGDNSILILGSTLVAGRFERVALMKLSEKEIGDLIR